MCGRYTLRAAPAEFWPADQLSLFTPRYNIAPSQDVAVVRWSDGGPRFSMLRWGLVPSWAKDEKIGYRTINARCESVADKPAFRGAFRWRRCLVLADGYYEWQTQGKKKQPYFFYREADQPFAFAGLWEIWHGPPGAKRETPLQTCTLITTDANEQTTVVHDRMPAILQPEDYELWLDPQFEGKDTLLKMLRPYPAGRLRMHPVSTLVNKPTNESPECVHPIVA